MERKLYLAEDPPGPGLVEVAEDDPDVLLLELVDVVRDVVGEGLGRHHVHADRVEVSHELVVGQRVPANTRFYMKNR